MWQADKSRVPLGLPPWRPAHPHWRTVRGDKPPELRATLRGPSLRSSEGAQVGGRWGQEQARAGQPGCLRAPQTP